MQDEVILTVLKTDLQISADDYNVTLKNIIQLAEAAILKEGITLDKSSTEDSMLIEMYAAYLYRKRREQDTTMPRYLRYMLNNRLFAEKAGAKNG